MGDYKCTITNSIGEATAEKTVNGMHVKTGSIQLSMIMVHLSLSLSLSLSFSLFLSALEVADYESPIIVGLSGTLHCSTILNITKMEWYEAGVNSLLKNSTISNNYRTCADTKHSRT